MNICFYAILIPLFCQYFPDPIINYKSDDMKTVFNFYVRLIILTTFFFIVRAIDFIKLVI